MTRKKSNGPERRAPIVCPFASGMAIPESCEARFARIEQALDGLKATADKTLELLKLYGGGK